MSDAAADARLNVFISHSWMDKQLADRLAHDLEEFANVWLDYRNLRPGDSIQATIDAALARMDLVLLVWTEHAERSQGVKQEILTCLGVGVRLVPCIVAHDEAGRPRPRLSAPIGDLLGIDFHHFGTGVARLAEYIVSLQSERLPAAARRAGQPAQRMLHSLQGYMQYLANYRKLRNVPDEREYWVDRIITEIEQFVNAGGDAQQVQMLLDIARQQEALDPEGTGTLVARLEHLLGVSPDLPAAEVRPAPHSAPERSDTSGNRQRRRAVEPTGTVDELAARVAQHVPVDSAEIRLAGVKAYIDGAPDALESLTIYAHESQSIAGVRVVGVLQRYLDEADDLVPDQRGRLGLLDDAWLILNTAFRLIESGLLPPAAVPIDWPTIIAADHVVRAIMPPAVLAVLTDTVMEILQTIGAEVTAYQPWLTPQGRGYSPVLAQPSSAGGTWEDRMNAALLGTGLSV